LAKTAANLKYAYPYTVILLTAKTKVGNKPNISPNSIPSHFMTQQC